MPEVKVQDAKNHAKWDPWFHFVLSPIMLANAIYWGSRLTRHPSWTDAWGFVVSIGLVIAAFKLRTNALKVQDRVIRLEERLRLERVLPASMHPKIQQLSVEQLIGIRFASDGELESLVNETLSKNYDRKQVKEAIKVWRPDDFRV